MASRLKGLSLGEALGGRQDSIWGFLAWRIPWRAPRFNGECELAHFRVLIDYLIGFGPVAKSKRGIKVGHTPGGLEMLTFAQLNSRLTGLLEDLDGELWTGILEGLNPPGAFPSDETIHEMCFRDAKALAGYIPDLRAIIKANSPKRLDASEIAALRSLKGLLNLAARLPVIILSIPDYKDNENLINVYNGYRQTLKEIDEYLAMA